MAILGGALHKGPRRPTQIKSQKETYHGEPTHEVPGKGAGVNS